MISKKTPPGLGVGQILHFGALSVLLAATWFGWNTLGKPYPVVFWTAICIPIAHQVFVWLAWRLELRSGKISSVLGFQGYIIAFFILFGGRFVALIILASRDNGSLGLSSLPQIVLTSICTVLGVYAMYSTSRYFGLARASGADHFDPKYRELPLVKKGIFRFTSNGMYLFAFLLVWAAAIGFNSSATLLVAAFSHIYIWIHFFATEKPDMKYLYGS